MRETEDTTQMGELNNAITVLIDNSDCTVIEIIAVLRLLVLRLEKAFELEVMGNPLTSIANRLAEQEEEKK